ncbi:MAG TPA: hypothetical protein VFP96_01820 [Candidatus Acidoferrum sp.]|nr:hypothetical protein [Candidatus Acidoferrum sp.]
MELSSELEANLRELASAGPVELRENGARVAPLSTLSWEVRGSAAKPLLHLWSANHNLTRRVLAITAQSEDHLALAVERFGRTRPDRLEFVRMTVERSPRELDRQDFCRWIAAICVTQFPDQTPEAFSTHQDLEHSLSGNYPRGILRSGKSQWAVFAANEDETAGNASRCLAFALLWLDHLRSSSSKSTIAGLRLLLPKGLVPGVIHLLGAIHHQLNIEVYEFDRGREVLERVNPSALSNISSWLVALREAQSLLDRAKPDLDRVASITRQRVTLHPNVAAGQVALRFHGLLFARWEDKRIFFGVPDAAQELTPASENRLKHLLQELERYRNSLASDAMQSLYRAQPERWLESLIREDVTRIDAALDSRFAYTQVLANAGGENGILDVLTATRSGRVAIVELKASEFLSLPLQAADYWLRIRRHLEQGDIAHYGYFPGVELQSAPPIVYLVAPALRFHPATDRLLRMLTPQLEFVRVGLSENWRRGIRVVLRQ